MECRRYYMWSWSAVGIIAGREGLSVLFCGHGVYTDVWYLGYKALRVLKHGNSMYGGLLCLVVAHPKEVHNKREQQTKGTGGSTTAVCMFNLVLVRG